MTYFRHIRSRKYFFQANVELKSFLLKNPRLINGCSDYKILRGVQITKY